MNTIAIIDDYRPFSELLTRFLGQQPGWTVIGTALDATSGLDLIVAKRPDLALIDVKLPTEDGFWVTARLAALGANVAVALMSFAERDDYAAAVARAGAVAYLPKLEMTRQLPELLRTIQPSLAAASAVRTDSPIGLADRSRSHFSSERHPRDDRGPARGQGLRQGTALADHIIIHPPHSIVSA